MSHSVGWSSRTRCSESTSTSARPILARTATLLTGSRIIGRRGGRARRARLGPLPPDPGEFAASQRLAEILDRLRERYDIVIVDTPPLLWVGDALTLSSQADGMIVIARMKGIGRPMLRELRRILEARADPKARLRGHRANLGGARRFRSKEGYSYGYGYGYGSGQRPRGEGGGGEREARQRSAGLVADVE